MIRFALFLASVCLSILLLACAGLALIIMSIPLGTIYAWDWYRSGH